MTCHTTVLVEAKLICFYGEVRLMAALSYDLEERLAQSCKNAYFFV